MNLFAGSHFLFGCECHCTLSYYSTCCNSAKSQPRVDLSAGNVADIVAKQTVRHKVLEMAQ